MDGSLVVAKRFKFFLPYWDKNDRTTVQRIYAFLQAITPVVAPLTLTALVFTPYMLAGLAWLAPTLQAMDRNRLRTIFAALWATSELSKHFIFGSPGFGSYIRWMRQQIWFTPCECRRQADLCMVLHADMSRRRRILYHPIYFQEDRGRTI
jgi:hypothetical protein